MKTGEINKYDVDVFDTRIELDLYLSGEKSVLHDELRDVSLTTCYDLIRNRKSLIVWGEKEGDEE